MHSKRVSTVLVASGGAAELGEGGGEVTQRELLALGRGQPPLELGARQYARVLCQSLGRDVLLHL